jgi:hypothetical protein
MSGTVGCLPQSWHNARAQCRRGSGAEGLTSKRSDEDGVEKKQKAPAAPEASGAAEKRKAEDGEAQTSQDKKARLEEGPAL